MSNQPISRRSLLLAACAGPVAAATGSRQDSSPVLERLPGGALQPLVATDSRGVIHRCYFQGEPLGGDLFHARSTDGGLTFSRPAQVNSTRGAVVATGTIRGAQLAIGRDDRLHFAWNGSAKAAPRGPKGETPMNYTRMNDAGTGFEAERNVIQSAYGLDGGGALAADHAGQVYVLWHAPAMGEQGEDKRRVWVARSRDDGRTFDAEKPAEQDANGACGCCGMKAVCGMDGSLYVMYRSARATVHRDMYLLTSRNGGATFESALLDPWEVGYCVMSSAAFAAAPGSTVAAWETKGQIRFTRISSSAGIQDAPGQAGTSKHPAFAVNGSGDVILVWTEGTGWKKGGSVAWQVYDKAGRRKGEPGRAAGLPAFSFAAAFARPDGRFSIVY